MWETFQTLLSTRIEGKWGLKMVGKGRWLDEWKRENWLESKIWKQFQEDRKIWRTNKTWRINLKGRIMYLSHKPSHGSKSMNNFSKDLGQQYGIILAKHDRIILWPKYDPILLKEEMVHNENNDTITTMLYDSSFQLPNSSWNIQFVWTWLGCRHKDKQSQYGLIFGRKIIRSYFVQKWYDQFLPKILFILPSMTELYS